MPTMHLEELPSELLTLIMSQLHLDGLIVVRLVSKQISVIATQLLFRKITVRKSVRSVKQLKAIAAHDQIATLVREINFCYDLRVSYYGERQSSQLVGLVVDEDTHKFKSVLQSLGKFRALSAVSLTFEKRSGDCLNDRDYRRSRLTDTLNALHQHGICFRTLTVDNLHNFPDPDMTSNEAFFNMLQRLDQLDIRFTESDIDFRRGPNRPINYARTRLMTFWPHFRATWLEPSSASLTSLALHNNDNWGLLPVCFNLQDICFPNLKTLTLSLYTIGYDDQIDWILAQKTMRSLCLRDCSILRSLCILNDHLTACPIQTDGWHECPSEMSFTGFAYLGRWATYFRRIQEELDLTSFSFSFSNNRFSGPDMAETCSSGNGLSQARYINCGTDMPGTYHYQLFNNTHVDDDPGHFYRHDGIRNCFGHGEFTKFIRETGEMDSEAYHELIASVQYRVRAQRQ